MTRPVRLPAADARQQNTTVFVAMPLAVALECRAANRLGDRTGFTATAELLDAYGLTPDKDEDADFAAQTHASMAALLDAEGGPRLVVAVNAPATKVEALPVSDARYGLGRVAVSSVGWTKVLALFVDEPAASEAVEAARAELSGAEGREGQLTAAASSRTVAQLLEEHALLWFLPGELDDVQRMHA